MTRIFLHGLESSSRGAKASFLRSLFPEMLVPDFKGSLAERMSSLHEILAGRESIMITGSSFGGVMAAIFAMEKPEVVDRLVLLAPALNFPELRRYKLQRIAVPTRMIIGREDAVTPLQEVVPVARKIFANLVYDEVADDHMLAKTFRTLDWKNMLQEEKK